MFNHWRSLADAKRQSFRRADGRACAFASLLAVPLLIGSAAAGAQTLTTIYNFGAQRGDGTFPWAITGDGQGNLYGTASLDGTRDGDGALFRLSPPAEPGGIWTETVLYRFRGSPDGSTPEGTPVLTVGGRIFGTTYLGGLHDLGTAFVAGPGDTPDAPWKEKPIYHFGAFAGDGTKPNSGLLYARGKLYGVASEGGATGRGTVFMLTPPLAPDDDWTETILHSFGPDGDASFPLGELVGDRHGNLYGNSVLGGVNNLGAVYRLVPPAHPGQPWTESVIHSFNGTDGSSGEGRLLLANDGVLYGTTGGGGPEEGGTVFKLTPPSDPSGSWTHSIVYAFTGGRDGGSPAAGVSMDAQGRLWGTTTVGGNGGPNFGGVLFVLHPPANPGDPWTETVLSSFGGPNGFRPISPLVWDGAIYGLTTQGGAFGTGTAFQFKF
jgi:uncharacterized repeat protein (TIGR03803 family)